MSTSERAPEGAPTLSIVVPTYQEAENIPVLSEEIRDALEEPDIDYELIFVDDNSQDGSEEICEDLAEAHPIRIIVRRDERGLATAVIRGIVEARGELVVVMDADLSHPPSAIPEMVRRLQSGDADFVLGSRYVPCGSIHENWSFFRTLNSKIPSLLTRPLTPLKDPMSGFFGLKKRDVPSIEKLSPIGYKIALEVYVKGEFSKPSEVPIHFSERRHGESKLSFKEQLNFLRHLRRLYQYKHPLFTELVQFAAVGGSGFIVDVLAYLGLQAALGVDHRLARALSFVAAASWNWAANRTITFDKRPKTSKLKQWPAFVLTSTMGFLINWGCYVLLTGFVPFFDQYRILALMVGVIAGMGSNFLAARTFVFKPARAGAEEGHEGS